MFLATMYVLHLEKHKIRKSKTITSTLRNRPFQTNSFNGRYIDEIKKVLIIYVIIFIFNETIYCGIEEDLFMKFYMILGQNFHLNQIKVFVLQVRVLSKFEFHFRHSNYSTILTTDKKGEHFFYDEYLKQNKIVMYNVLPFMLSSCMYCEKNKGLKQVCLIITLLWTS